MKRFCMGVMIAWASMMAQAQVLQENKDKDLVEIGRVSKNGFLIGIELSGGEATLSQRGSIDFVDLHQIGEKSDCFLFDGGLKLGYQHYFGLNLGIRVGGYVGAGNPVTQKIAIQKALFDYDVSYLPIKTGIDIEGLWDFWEEGQHTLSLSFGFGYRFTHWQKIKSVKNSELKSIFSNLSDHELCPQVGISYYYERHQIGFTYRLGNLLKSQNNKSVGKIVEEDGNKPLLSRGSIQTEITQKSYLSIGYSYRF